MRAGGSPRFLSLLDTQGGRTGCSVSLAGVCHWARGYVVSFEQHVSVCGSEQAGGREGKGEERRGEEEEM